MIENIVNFKVFLSTNFPNLEICTFKNLKNLRPFKCQFECSTCEWNDSFENGKIHVLIVDTLEYSELYDDGKLLSFQAWMI